MMKNINLSEQTIFMTGATSGLGKAAALNLAKNGSTLIVLSRSEEKGKILKEEHKRLDPKGKGKIEYVIADLNDFSSIVTACKEVKMRYPKLDCVINNAGIMNFEYKESKDGIEQTLQVNLLAPMLLSHFLSSSILHDRGAKLIYTTSGLHQGQIQFQDIEFRKKFSSFKSYRNSKLGIIQLCRLLAPSLEAHSIGIYSQHPGMVRTNLGKQAGWLSRSIFWLMGKSPEKGAENLLFLSETDREHLVSGAYYADKQVTKTTEESYDLESAARLLNVIRSYLEEFIDRPSIIFPG